MGVFIFGTIYFLAAYLTLGAVLERDTLNHLFLYGIASIPVIAILSMTAASIIGRIRPLPPNHASGAHYGPLYYRLLRINGLLKLAFLIILYHSVAIRSSRPFLVLVAGSAVFLLSLPQHLFRVWTRAQAPDRYGLFILNHGALGHRFLVVALNLVIQSVWIALSRS